jgi:probable LLM family oxidoreductase
MPGFPLVFGVDTFGDLAFDLDGHPLTQAETIRRVVDEGVLAEEVGLEFFGIGEHHTNDWPMPAGDVVLAAIAARTRKIHLGSAVLVLSSDDPVRVFQRYSTLHALSGGRAEVILGRGSSIESFPLFGYDLADYETLFEEKTQLFAELLKGGVVSWQGTTRPALEDVDVVPHLESGPFPVWLGVGGSPESVVRAARHGFGLMLAIIGGPPARFTPFSQLFAAALDKFGQPPRPVGVHAPGHIAEADEQARDELWPHYREILTRVGRQRGWPPPTKEQFLRETGPDGAWHVGSPDTVARKIAANLPALGASRFDLKYGMVGLPHDTIMRTIELYGTKVVPLAQELLADAEAVPEPAA